MITGMNPYFLLMFTTPTAISNLYRFCWDFSQHLPFGREGVGGFFGAKDIQTSRLPCMGVHKKRFVMVTVQHLHQRNMDPHADPWSSGTRSSPVPFQHKCTAKGGVPSPIVLPYLTPSKSLDYSCMSGSPTYICSRLLVSQSWAQNYDQNCNSHADRAYIYIWFRVYG